MLRRLLAAMCLAGAAFAPASAGSLRVDPVEIVINDDRRTASVTISNEGSQPATLRITPMAWSQTDGLDRYEETATLITSPPIVTVKPGAKQIVRIGFRDPARQAAGSYRLIVEETPRSDVAGVQVVLRLNLPVFSRIERGDASSLQWSTTRNAKGEWTVEASNPGDRFVRLTPADLVAGTGLDHNDTLRLGVVLPRSSRKWELGTAPVTSNPMRWRQITREENEGGRPALAQRAP